MSASPSITCPKCHHAFELSAAVSAGIEERLRAQFETENATRLKRAEEAARASAKKDADVEIKALQEQLGDTNKRLASAREREQVLLKRERDLEDRQKSLDREVQDRLKAERTTLSAQLKKEAADESAAQLAALNDDLARNRQKLAEAQNNELALRQQKQALEEEKRQFELDKQRALDEARAKIQEKARADASEEFRLKALEKDKLIADMQRQVEELKRKAEQGSQQLQGEVLELELESILRSAFPHDQIEPVPKGTHGGDVLQRVAAPGGAIVGTILWESKRTKNWSDGWLSKLRGDQRDAQAQAAVLLTVTMPKGVETFGELSGIWVTGSACSLPLAAVLRAGIIEAAAARQSSEGRHTKMELVYEYLTGPIFRQRVEAIMDTWKTMREDLDTERKVITKQWAKRAAQIDAVLLNTAGMYGDLQGIAGRSLPEIEGLEMKALESD